MPHPFAHHLRTAFKPSNLVLSAKAVIWVAAIKIFLNDNVVTVTPITGSSMAPTLSPKYALEGKTDKVLWNIWSSRKNLQRGDIVHFMSPNEPEVFAVKRIIGLPGDTVLLDPRRRPEVTEGPEPIAAKAWDSWRGRAVVPPGHVWVEGDNWRKTSDSNWYGPLSKSLITGKAVAVVWPRGRFWSRPWEGFKGRTKAVKGKEPRDWTTETLPLELAEVGDLGLPKG